MSYRFDEAVTIMARLRGPDGCPWDLEQNFDSIRKYTLEETYEVFDAIERRDWSNLCEELGDLFLQVLFYSQMAAESGHFTIDDVVDGLNRKLIRRHPHVFGEAATAGIATDQVLKNWETIKQAEKAGQSGADKPVSALHGISRAVPSLMEAAKLGSRASKAGFDWPTPEGLFAKLEEETKELHQAIAEGVQEEVTAEMGDLLFTVVNLARHLKVDPEFALRQTNLKFRRRFAAMETSSAEPLETLTPEQLETLWSQAKQNE
jgi:nucleoside triphosphate diphosphatase